MIDHSITDFIEGLPKAELHLHICGTLEPVMMMLFAQRNGISIPYHTVEEISEAYQFHDLQEFLDIYHQGTLVLTTERDFYELTSAYLARAIQDDIVHTEFSIDPQTFLKRGISIEPILEGILHAMEDARRDVGIQSLLVLDFIREMGVASALQTLKAAEPYLHRIAAIGLGSAELGHPPSKFQRVFDRARDKGLRLCAHAGEEGPAEYVREAVELLKVDRVDHGISAMDDPALVAYIAGKQIPLTLCPLSNKALHVTPDLSKYPVREMLKHRMLITINSDDPAYFGGYLNANYLAVARSLDLSPGILAGLARNSFKASFLPEEEKARFIGMVDDYYRAWEEDIT